MQVIIDDTTLWVALKARIKDSEVEHYITTIQEQFKERFDYNFDQMSIGQFCELLDGKPPLRLMRIIQNPSVTVLDVVRVRNAVDTYMKEFAATCKTYSVAQTPLEQQAAAGLLQTSIIESMLMFAREYFGLPNFGEAEKITLLEYKLAKKHVFISQTYERKKAKLYESAAKSKRRSR